MGTPHVVLKWCVVFNILVGVLTMVTQFETDLDHLLDTKNIKNPDFPCFPLTITCLFRGMHSVSALVLCYNQGLTD